ncbi:MAG: TonB-dependent receptor plug domain-containing protein [Marinifilaceae bacterium]|nr:TonB-dependent receptor plug domain-containing protein [Marinifilaceae bacterium]
MIKCINNKNIAIPNVHININKAERFSITNEIGSCKINTNKNSILHLHISHINYESIDTTINTNLSKIIFKLKLKENKLNEIKIKSRLQESIIGLNSKHIDYLPVSYTGGIESLIKSLQGVSSNNELSSQYNVRGGNFDENLVYINDVEINRSMLAKTGQQEGMSLINPMMVSSVYFSNGAFDVNYGDKMSSVLDVRYSKHEENKAWASASLLGADAGFAHNLFNNKLYIITGIRYQTTKYLLNSLDTKADYTPDYRDIQSYSSYKLNRNWELNLWLSVNNNKYKFEPKERQAKFGTINNSMKLSIYFDGQEKDEFHSDIESIAIKHKNTNSILKLILSRAKIKELENLDILGQYYLDELFISNGGNSENSIEHLGIGSYIDHARNKYDKQEYSAKIRYQLYVNQLKFKLGCEFKHRKIESNINEWQYQDSAGYSIPNKSDNIEFAYINKENHKFYDKSISAYINTEFKFNKISKFRFKLGIRTSYWDYNKEYIHSPRFKIRYNHDKNSYFEFATGIYSQIPNYKEMLSYNSKLFDKPLIQKSHNYSLSYNNSFQKYHKNFHLAIDLFYKDLKQILPYDIENLRIKYYGEKQSSGYAYGIDCRLNGEFIKNTDSWISLSLLKTEENIKNDKYGNIPRPTDQLYNISLFFQDYLSKNTAYKMYLMAKIGAALPAWVPKSNKQEGRFEIPAYKRLDIGFSRRLSSKKPKTIKSAWLKLELFNILDINNTISYFWVKDVSSNNYAVPNYLTGRRLNLKIQFAF